jgi:peptide/nickel transport system permease protein
MLRLITVRLFEALVVLLVMSFLIYGLIGLMPGDPIDLMINANPHLSPADAARLRALYGLDLPIWTRYLNWLAAALQGDLGYSRLIGRPVLEVLEPRLLNTLLLLSLSLALSLAIAIPLGVHAAQRPHSAMDAAVNLLCFAGISVPPFWLALIFIILFSVTLGVLPAGGMAPVGGDGGLGERLPYLVMPVATLTLVSVGGYTRFVRAALLEQLRQDYVRTARAKGVPERGVVWRHALRNAMIPVVTIVALGFGNLFSGALVTETMFAYLGMGKLIYDSILGNDYNIALVGLLLATLMTLVGNLLADLGYAALDPRISFTETRT